jgi:hypothetical protein
MPTSLTSPALEVVLQGLHESEIRCGIKNEPPAGGITAWIDFGSRTEKATFYGTIVGDSQVWPSADLIGAWLHETRCAFSLIAPMPKRTKTSLRAPRQLMRGWLVAFRNPRCFRSRDRVELLDA